MAQQQHQQQDGLTSTTAPGKVFVSRSELAQHYKSDWHKYNLKRREAGLPLLNEDNFQARLQAALALKKEQEEREKRDGTDHLKHKNNDKKKGNKRNKKSCGKGQKLGGGGVVEVSQAAAYDRIKNNSTGQQEEGEGEKKQVETDRPNEDDVSGTMQIDENAEKDEEAEGKQEGEEELPVIEPRQCLFDKHMSANIECNVDRMTRKYGFFIPDEEYLIDLEGFLGYCQEKIKLGHCCLYCQKLFTTYHGCQKHMISKRHTKIRYEMGIDMDEFDPFYDFTEADEEFLEGAMTRNNKTDNSVDDSYQVLDDDKDNDDDDNDDGEWEDVSDDEGDEMDVDAPEDDNDDDDDEGLYAGYEDEIAKYGYDITPLGELIFPDGRIIGHRGLKRYYKQRIPTRNEDRTAVVAARRAAGDRLYRGRVYNMYNNDGDNSNETALALSRAGINPGSAAGRAGNGILVRSGGGSFTALSLYRYRAVAKKARRDDARGKRLENKVRRPINKMDKKANRLYNNVSVAHAKR